MIERRYQATARAWVLSPQVLGPVAADVTRFQDAFSAGYLMATAARLHAELGRAMQDAERKGKRLATLTVEAEIRFVSPEQRQQFTQAIQQALVQIIARHTSPANTEQPAGRRFRMVFGCYPIPSKEISDDQETAAA
jgi:hypothetical protein